MALRFELPGGAVLVRPLATGETEVLAALFAGLGARSRERRFFAAKPRLTEAELAALAHVDERDRVAVVAFDASTLRPVGIARFVRDAHDPAAAEVAFAVVDERQGCGIGSVLALVLADRARRAGILRLRALLYDANPAALALMRRLGEITKSFAGGELTVVAAVREAAA